ncbi:MAG TPA: GNAT family protein [Gaiellales bacterium]
MACARAGKGFGPDDALPWIEAQWRRRQDGAGLSLAIADAGSGEALGCISLNARPQPGTAPVGDPAGIVFVPQPGSFGIGYWVIERARGRGLASRAVALLARWAFAEAGTARIEALVEPDNIASLRVVEKAGFEREGRLRGYLGPEADGRRGDVFVYSLLPSDLLT